ncbi:MAG: ribosome recycling factor [Candidatus Bipolaricaulota bacterium]|nr:ribosome recycling factor [Candidatus Bipolaricaulota bacterium]
MPEQVQREMAEHMKRTLDVLKEHLAKVQTGRANPAMVDDVMVDYYGTRTSLKQLATISAPDANLLVVQPYDKTQMAAVEKAILAADLGLNPASDGNVVRIKVPKLSEERRRELTKVIKARAEETKVALRNVRREANEKLDAMKKDGTLSEDAHRRYRDKTDEAVREASQTVDTLIEQKSKQIQTI